ncbi:MAG: hypothetical protein AAFX39_00910 [Pseudomonadota bacterium]
MRYMFFKSIVPLLAVFALTACQTTGSGSGTTSAASTGSTVAATATPITSGMSCGELQIAYRENLTTMSRLEDQVKARLGVPDGQQTQGLVAQSGTPEEQAASEAATAAAGQAIIRANEINCIL